MTEDERSDLEAADTVRPAPKYQHDCPLCSYLGVFEFGERTFDLYFCSQGHAFPTVIARGSSNPHDYSSGILLAQFDPPLYEALRRAKEAELVAQDVEVTLGG